MRFAQRQFRPGLWPTLITLILLPVLLRLGFWQLERAEEKRQIQARFDAQYARPAVPVSELASVQDSEFRLVSVTGVLDNQRSFLLDNQVHDRQAGFHVLTPLKLSGNGYVLLNRGWVAQGKSRADKPQLDKLVEPVSIQGRIKLPSAPGLKLSDRSFHDRNWPIIVQWIDFNDMQELTGHAFLPFIIRLEPDQPHGFVRDWQIINAQPEQSTSYAVQWFTLAGVLSVLYLLLNLRKPDDAESDH